MQISKPEVSRSSREALYQVRVDFSQGTKTLWYKLDGRYGDLLTDTCDAAAVALLIPAMAAGEDLHVGGVLSERLYYHLAGPYQRLMQIVIPSLRRVAVIPCELQPEGPKARGVATGFSGGIDSYCLLADHFYSQSPAGFQITHLLYNNVGSHGSGAERLFSERFERLKPFAERTGLPFVRINSNLTEFFEPRLGFQRTHTPRNVSVALLLQNGVGRYLCASTYSFQDTFIGPTHCTAYSDNSALPMLGTERLDVLSVGGEYTRVQKTQRVGSITDSYDSLDVCTDPRRAGNCSACGKCLRTQLTLEIAGLLPRYAAVFDLNVYQQHRQEFIASAPASKDSFLREIVQFADESRFNLRAA